MTLCVSEIKNKKEENGKKKKKKNTEGETGRQTVADVGGNAGFAPILGK